MNDLKSIRILWLLSNSVLGTYEVPLFKQMGINKIFLAKCFPYHEVNHYVTPDFSNDSYLGLLKEELNILNNQNWHDNISQEVWDIVNANFDIAFIGFFPKQIDAFIQNFKNIIVLRAFGLTKQKSYTKILYENLGIDGFERLMNLKDRFWFGAAYEHLYQSEGTLLQQRHCYLPLGLPKSIVNHWLGDVKQILFFCPKINTSSNYKKIYQEFVKNFSEFDYTIEGYQPIEVIDKAVTGSISPEEYEHKVRSHRVMFYHSSQLHQDLYPLFLAMSVGMPIVFMGGGILDKLGGRNQPGRCKSIREARVLIKKILNDDLRLIGSIQKEQKKILKYFSHEHCSPIFSEGMHRIIDSKPPQGVSPPKKKRIGIFLPIPYSGGSLRGAIVFANAIMNAAEKIGDRVEVVFAHLDIELYKQEKFEELNKNIQRRAFTWETLCQKTAKCAMTYAGHLDWQPTAEEYIVPNDAINYFLDCDLWIMISDRIPKALLPIRPYVCMIYDYLSHHLPFLSSQQEKSIFNAAHNAKRILVTTKLTAQDASQYAGLHPERIFIMPILVPDFTEDVSLNTNNNLNSTYFIWTTNRARHKNHVNSLLALREYYEAFDGVLECHVTGVETDTLFTSSSLKFDYLLDANDIYKKSDLLRQHIKFYGELSNKAYRKKLQNSAFLWHTAQIDNGTFSVIEAAQLHIPSLSSYYPPMEQLNDQFNLNLNWMNSSNPQQMAEQLKHMEINYLRLKQQLQAVNAEQFKHDDMAELKYWKVIKECL